MYVCTYRVSMHIRSEINFTILQAIRPYIPQKNPVLGKHIYEMVLNEFLNTDTKVRMYKVIIAHLYMHYGNCSILCVVVRTCSPYGFCVHLKQFSIPS